MSLALHNWMGDVHQCSRASVSEMTYTVSSGTLNSTIPYYTIPCSCKTVVCCCRIIDFISHCWFNTSAWYSTIEDCTLLEDEDDVCCLLQITKIINKKKAAAYSFRQSFPLCGMTVYLFDTPRKGFSNVVLPRAAFVVTFKEEVVLCIQPCLSVCLFVCLKRIPPAVSLRRYEWLAFTTKNKWLTVTAGSGVGHFLDLCAKYDPVMQCSRDAVNIALCREVEVLRSLAEVFCWCSFLGRLPKVDLIILEGKNVRPSVRPQKVSSIWMKFGM